MMAGKWLAVAVFLCISTSCVVGQSVTCEQWCQNGLNFYSKFVQSQLFLQGFFSSCLTQCPGATTSATSTTRTSTTPTTSTSTPTSTKTTTTTTSTTSTTTRPPTTTSPSATSGCGVASYVNRYKIVGGQKAEECEFPWMVGVSVDSNFCGGSIVDNLHIVTAAHCVRDRSTREVISPTRVIIRTGSSYLNNMRAYYVKTVTIDARHVPGINDYDVAVLTLIEPLVFNNCTAPICLPYSGDDATYASYCIAAGWGLTSSYDTSLSRNLMKVVLPIVDNSLCMQSYSSQYINDLKICAGDFYYGGVDSCQGDSGGPLMCYENGRFVLHGIVSFGATCAQPRYPGVYTKVANSQILEFIKKNLN